MNPYYPLNPNPDLNDRLWTNVKISKLRNSVKIPTNTNKIMDKYVFELNRRYNLYYGWNHSIKSALEIYND